MGVNYFQAYLFDKRNNISLEERKWEIDSEKYNDIRNNFYDYKQTEINGDFILVIDAQNLFYEIGRKLFYFTFDYKLFIMKFKEECLYIYVYIFKINYS